MEAYEEALALLQNLISVSSFSDEENIVAGMWKKWLESHGVKNVKRFHNNVYALTEYYDPGKPVLLIDSHMDTVRPVPSYTRDPFKAVIEEGRLYGLGSNDAGGAGVCLAATFLKFKDREDLPYNLLFAITASEEKMGENGMRAFLPHLKEEGLYPDMAIVGEPTSLRGAIAERGLVVCDVEVKGKAGHAARNTGENAIYRAIEDIEKIRKFHLPKESEVLGPVKATVTIIEGGTQHNVIPDKCKYVVDIRTTDAFSNEDTVKLLQETTRWSTFTPRSTRIRASVLQGDHPLMHAMEKTGIETFVSPTTSDMAVMYDIPSLKLGPGESERSHTADEYIELNEIKEGIRIYENLLKALAEVMN